MTTLRALALAALALLVPMAPAAARVHGQMYCWIDLEFPIPCEPSDEEDEAAAAPSGAPPSAGVGMRSVDTQSVSLDLPDAARHASVRNMGAGYSDSLP